VPSSIARKAASNVERGTVVYGLAEQLDGGGFAERAGFALEKLHARFFRSNVAHRLVLSCNKRHKTKKRSFSNERQ